VIERKILGVAWHPSGDAKGNRNVSIISMTRKNVASLIEGFLSLVGFAVAGTLYVAYVRHLSLPCTSGEDCELLSQSRWGHIFGFPVSLLGAAGYACLFMLSALKLTSETARSAKAMLLLMLIVSTGGFCYSWYLQYVAKYLANEFCIYCRISAITMSLIFLVTWFEKIKKFNDDVVLPSSPA
jgi:uncharacterized membrane protein